MTAWLSVLGMGDDGPAGLSPAARALLDTAEVVIGGARHLALVETTADKREWPSPFAGARDLLDSLRGRNVVVLASGDPMWFGIGATLTRWLSPGEMRVLPHPGAFSLAAAALGWPLQECLCLTVHGRPLEALHLHLSPGRRLLVLAENGQSPAALARLLEKAGYGPSRLVVLEHLGGAGERLRDTIAEAWVGAAADLNTIAIECRPEPGALVLSEDGQSPAAVARLLEKAGYGPSRLVVLEHLGGVGERLRDTIAEAWVGEAADLNTIAIECRPEPGARLLSTVPGLPDDAFDHDGQLTKREIRAVTLAALAPLPGQMLWDVGAGCGSIAIEWMRAGGQAVAIEPRADRCNRIATNAAALGVPGLQVVRGSAPDALPYSDPDAIFVGGGVSVPGLLDACWSSLRPGGRLVANAVTAEGEAALIALHARFGGQMVRLSVSRLAPVGGFHTWHPAMPVTQFIGRKG